MQLADRVAIVTGASRGIGRAIAETFVREGARVALAARASDELDALAAALGRQAIAVPTDVVDEQAVAHLVERATAELGPIDILVNNAGLLRLSPVVATDLATWREILDVNLTGAFLCCRAVLPQMIERGRGAIINMASRAGKIATPMGAAYSASKFGLLALNKALAEEVKRAGIRVNAICPGFVETKMVQDAGIGAALESIMQPAEIAALALFLASDASSALVGAEIEAYGVTERPRG